MAAGASSSAGTTSCSPATATVLIILSTCRCCYVKQKCSMAHQAMLHARSRSCLAFLSTGRLGPRPAHMSAVSLLNLGPQFEHRSGVNSETDHVCRCLWPSG